MWPKKRSFITIFPKVDSNHHMTAPLMLKGSNLTHNTTTNVGPVRFSTAALNTFTSDVAIKYSARR